MRSVKIAAVCSAVAFIGCAAILVRGFVLGRSSEQQPENTEEQGVILPFHGPDDDGYWHSGYFGYDELSPDEIKELLEANPSDDAGPYYEIEPSSSEEPWVLGRISDEQSNAALNRLNAIRRIAKMSPVGLSEQETVNAQYGAWICDHIGEVTREPICEDNIPPEFYKKGAVGAGSSNMIDTRRSLATTIDIYANDFQFNNCLDVGHRQSIFNTRLGSTGFGMVGTVKSMSTADRSNMEQKDFDFIAWPSTGYMPLGPSFSMFSYSSPWSLSFSHNKVRVPDVSDGLTIVIRHNDEIISTLIYGRSPSQPYDAGSYMSRGEFIRVGYGYSHELCIVFRPGVQSPGELIGECEVEVMNLREKESGETFSMKYKVTFFDLSMLEAAEATDEPEESDGSKTGSADGAIFGDPTVCITEDPKRFCYGIA